MIIDISYSLDKKYLPLCNLFKGPMEAFVAPIKLEALYDLPIQS